MTLYSVAGLLLAARGLETCIQCTFSPFLFGEGVLVTNFLIR